MARKPRCVVPGYPQHVTQRGNNRQAWSIVGANSFRDLNRRGRCFGRRIAKGFAPTEEWGRRFLEESRLKPLLRLSHLYMTVAPRA